MSGIVGVVDRGTGTVDPAVVETMHERIAHRGPDGGDTWIDGRAGLGHQLLVTTPEATVDEQPLRDNACVVTADARIDNRTELLEALSLYDAGRPVPDSELVLEAYREWGPACVEHLYGAFAFAIWDEETETLFCARDHVGVKPFYYHDRDGVFAFASEQKSLAAIPSVGATVDETKIGDFLCGLFDDERRTFYEDFVRLPPAHAMLVDADGIDRWRYWDLDPTKTITLESDAAYERRFRELFEQAVRCRLRSNGPVGAALSGGLDSSSITVMARDLLAPEEPLRTFSNVFDNAPSSDERAFIEAVVDREGIDSHYLFMDDVGSLADLDAVFDHYDQPPHNTMHFARWEKAKYARRTGVNVVLCGALGDSAVDYGLGLLPQLFRTGRWLRLHRELRAMSDVVEAPARHLFARHVLKPLLPDPILRYHRERRGQPVQLDAANPTVDPAFVDRTGLRSRYEATSASDSIFHQTARTWQYESLTSGRVSATFETSDVANAAFGIEQRYPFTDVRLLEFSLAIPPSQQLKDGWTRSIIRRALDDLLPAKVQWRPWKTMMNEAFWNALAEEDDHLRGLFSEPGHLSQYVDVDALEAAYDRFNDEPNSRDARALWRALSLSTWIETTTQRESRQPTHTNVRDHSRQLP